MATCTMVPLRSVMPPTGRMTVRLANPVTDPVVVPSELSVEDLLDVLETSTTPQVAVAPATEETAARKGGDAR